MFPFTTGRALPLRVPMRSKLEHGLRPPALAPPISLALNVCSGSRSSVTSSWKMLKSPSELSANYGREAADGESTIAHTIDINLPRETYRFGQFKIRFHNGVVGKGTPQGRVALALALQPLALYVAVPDRCHTLWEGLS